MAIQDASRSEVKEIILNRMMLAISAAIYLLWWFAVEAILPEAYNPFFSRLMVVAYFVAAFVGSYFFVWIREHLRGLFLTGAWLLSAHFFYLFYFNRGSTDWIVGCFITVIALNTIMTSTRALIAYSVYVAALSAWTVYLLPELNDSIFPLGIATIIFQANMGQRYRSRILESLDASHRKLADERVRTQSMAENVRIRDEFISIASHELKTPLTVLKLRAQMMSLNLERNDERFRSPEPMREFVDLITRQCDRLTNLVETMMDTSRISSGQLTVSLQPIDLAVIVREVVSLARTHVGIQGAGSTITLDCPERLIVDADPYRIEQVIENLLINAIRYGNKQPIRVSLEKLDEHVKLSVADRGQGIPPESMERIFRRFERAVSSRNVSGLGLGLYIAKQIVEAHGGRISVESAVAVGSTFTVTLPANPRQA